MEDSETSDLEMACRNFVKFKDALDKSLEIEWAIAPIERFARWFIGISSPNGIRDRRPAIHPGDFVRHSLPFSDQSDGANAKTQGDVDPTLTVSGTYNLYDPIHSNIDANKVMDQSDTLVDNCVEHPELLRLFKIGRLPLYFASEGKNRVELFKKFRKCMKASVKHTSFPEPEDLLLHRVRPWGIYSLSCRDKKTELLPFRHVIPLLRAYGVADGEPYFDLLALYRLRLLRLDITSRLMKG